jgi:predicted phosphodiesterase
VRVFALSDIHVDFEVNARWIANLSAGEYRDDVLILAGDVTDTLQLLDWCLASLSARFRKVLFVPGNHDLWVARDGPDKDSLTKFAEVRAVAESAGASMRPYSAEGVSIVPILGWYDYSFGEPGDALKATWMDYRACRWPAGFEAREIATHFQALNETPAPTGADTVITFSHFLPRIDVMPPCLSADSTLPYPVLGSTQLERQLLELRSSIHVYGHSHINRGIEIDGVAYVNNAFGYPNETLIAAKQLLCIHGD